MKKTEPLIIRDDITIKIDGGGVAFSVDAMHRTQILLTYQTVTGSLTPGAHPGSYNGQDAYNDMLVTDDGISNGDRTSKRRNNVGGGHHR